MSTLNIKKFIKKHQYLRLGITRTIARFFPRQQDLQVKNTRLPGSQRPGTITRTITRDDPKARENPNQNIICPWEARSGSAVTRTIFRLIDPEDPPPPPPPPKKRGWGANARPPQASRRLDGLLIIFRYRILFGFCGIFCGCYVNHAIFSTIHKFLQLFYDLLPAEIIHMFVCYMATSDH